MIRHGLSLNLFLIASLLCCGACRSQSDDTRSQPPPAPSPSEPPAPTPTGQAAASATAPAAAPSAPPAPKSDPVDTASLKAGLAMMQPRITLRQEGLGKITPTGHARFFMHPADTKPAVLEFSTKGLSSLKLAPYIEDLGATAECRRDPAAGIVQLTWSTDTGKKGQLTVDRNYTGLVPVDLSKSSRLKLEVDRGNGTTLCDWFSVGFIDVK